MRKRVHALVAVAATLAGGVALSGPAYSATPSPTPAFDRGLPTTNLNGDIGTNPDRSNITWSMGNDWMTGDSFAVGSAGQTWVVTGIRTWNISKTPAFGDQFSDDALYLGTDGDIALVASGAIASGSNTDSNPNITHTAVTYADGEGYQAATGFTRQLWQNDVTGLDYVVTGGQPVDFAVDGTALGGYWWFNHGSNAALSGSTQQGADDRYLAWDKNDLSTAYTCDSGNNAGSSPCDGGWDKSSDIDVQVFASQVATSKSDCTAGGWAKLVRSNASGFKNQGDCIQYVNTGK